MRIEEYEELSEEDRRNVLYGKLEQFFGDEVIVHELSGGLLPDIRPLLHSRRLSRRQFDALNMTREATLHSIARQILGRKEYRKFMDRINNPNPLRNRR